jgi:hypothetical protein
MEGSVFITVIFLALIIIFALRPIKEAFMLKSSSTDPTDRQSDPGKVFWCGSLFYYLENDFCQVKPGLRPH